MYHGALACQGSTEKHNRISAWTHNAHSADGGGWMTGNGGARAQASAIFLTGLYVKLEQSPGELSQSRVARRVP